MEYKLGSGLAGYSGLFVFGRVLLMTSLGLWFRVMGMGKLENHNEEEGKGVVLQKRTPQVMRLEDIGTGWFTREGSQNYHQKDNNKQFMDSYFDTPPKDDKNESFGSEKNIFKSRHQTNTSKPQKGQKRSKKESRKTNIKTEISSKKEVENKNSLPKINLKIKNFTRKPISELDSNDEDDQNTQNIYNDAIEVKKYKEFSNQGKQGISEKLGSFKPVIKVNPNEDNSHKKAWKPQSEGKQVSNQGNKIEKLEEDNGDIASFGNLSDGLSFEQL